MADNPEEKTVTDTEQTQESNTEPTNQETNEGSSTDPEPAQTTEDTPKEEPKEEDKGATEETKDEEKAAAEPIDTPSTANGATANDTHAKSDEITVDTPGAASAGGENTALLKKDKGASESAQTEKKETVITTGTTDYEEETGLAYCWSHKMHIFLVLVIIADFAGVIVTILLRPDLMAGIGTLSCWVLLFALLGLMWMWTRKSRLYDLNRRKVFTDEEV